MKVIVAFGKDAVDDNIAIHSADSVIAPYFKRNGVTEQILVDMKDWNKIPWRDDVEIKKAIAVDENGELVGALRGHDKILQKVRDKWIVEFDFMLLGLVTDDYNPFFKFFEPFRVDEEDEDNADEEKEDGCSCEEVNECSCQSTEDSSANEQNYENAI